MEFFNHISCGYAGVRGFVTLYNHAIRFRYMVTEEALRRVRILAFWEKHGLRAAMDAFKVSRPTLFRWTKTLHDGGGKLDSLNPRSKAPKQRRKRIVDPRISDFIVAQRKEHQRLSKDKFASLLRQECAAWQIHAPSASTVGRIMADLKKQGRLPSWKELSFQARTGRFTEKTRPKRKKLRRKGYRPESGGDLVELDTVVKFVNGMRRYIVTALDVKTDFAFAYAYPNLSSQVAADFFSKLEHVLPFSITHVQTDNGLEFEHHFREAMTNRNIIHFHNYPKSPKLNAHVERFNRTIQEEFANRWLLHLRDDISSFNRKLIDWLLWYNTARPHWSLGLVSPMQHIISQLPTQKSQMMWTDTEI